jgi:hypothetical protein
MTSFPEAFDPLRSRAIFQMTDYSRIRSPVAKATMAGLTPGDGALFGMPMSGGSSLMGLSPMPKPTILRGLMPPPPPLPPQSSRELPAPHEGAQAMLSGKAPSIQQGSFQPQLDADAADTPRQRLQVCTAPHISRTLACARALPADHVPSSVFTSGPFVFIGTTRGHSRCGTGGSHGVADASR